MKKILIYPVLFLLFLTNTASMCSSDDDSPGTSASDVIATVSAGTWRITLFSEDGNNHTNDFTGYDFTFDDNNILTAVNGGNTVTGSWSVTGSGGDIDFNIAFASPPDFEELSEDWHILENTSSKVRLIHVSGGNGGTDLLTFEKN